MEHDAPSLKQQLTETLKGAESVVITTREKPGYDEIAAAVGLRLMLEKLDKVAEVVISTDIPPQLDFLNAGFINQELQGQRDFVVEIDQAKTEVDRIKYVDENKKLKFFVTPYNGSFSPDDVSFSYGDYHCDAIIGLGSSSVSGLTGSVTKESKLTQKAKFLLVSPGAGSSSESGVISWNDPNASSVCEMIMSMSESLGGGVLDEKVATALLTGIVDKTQHFTNQATTPKVMTMAAQLMAAGANQNMIVSKLQQPQETKPPKAEEKKSQDTKKDSKDSKDEEKTETKKEAQPAKPAKEEPPPNEFQVRKPKQGHDSQSAAKSSSEVSLKDQEAALAGPDQKADKDKQPDQPPTPPTPAPEAPKPAKTPPPQPRTAPADSLTSKSSTYVPAAQSNPPAPPELTPEQINSLQSAVPPPNNVNMHERTITPPVQDSTSAPTPKTPPSPNQAPPPQSQAPAQPNPNPSGQTESGGGIDMDAARRAVEEAHQQSPPPPPPTLNPDNQPPPQQ